MPQLLRNCTLIPIPKSGKDPSQSDNYNLSKVLEWCMLLQFGSYLSTFDLQFGFKSGASTDSCTGLLKNTIVLHIHRKTKVYGCFLDASKVFDRVSHNTLSNILEKRDVPPILLHFLWSWYKEQSCTVKWNSHVSDSFGVTNGVRQGGVLSPVLFIRSIWMSCSSTCLLSILVVMLAIIRLAPYVMLMILPFLRHYPLLSDFFSENVNSFANDHNLIFNAAKTQLICFRSSQKIKCTGKFFFSGHPLKFSDTVTHLGHVSHCSLVTSREPHLKCVKKPILS